MIEYERCDLQEDIIWSYSMEDSIQFCLMKTPTSGLPQWLILSTAFTLTLGRQGELRSANAQNGAGIELPAGAHVLEVRSLADQGYGNRSLVLWMVNRYG